MDQEIEIKLLFKNKREIMGTLRPEIKFLKKIDVLDIYFTKAKSSIKNRNDFIRIRKTKEKKELTYKGRSKNKGKIIKRTELNVGISSVELMEKILIRLGFKKVSEHYSKREYWSFGRIEIAFVKFIKPVHFEYMEIEANSKKTIERLLKRISNYVSAVKEDMFSKFDETNRNTI